MTPTGQRSWAESGHYGPVTGDAADLTVDPIVNLRDAHLVELYLHRVSAGRDDQIHALPDPRAHGRPPALIEGRHRVPVSDARD